MKRFISLIAGLAFLAPASAWACPTCKDGLHDGTAMGYAISILFMMGMPFLILAFWTVLILRLRAAANRSPGSRLQASGVPQS